MRPQTLVAGLAAFLVAGVAAYLLVSAGGRDTPPAETLPAAAETVQHGVAGAVPGSWEDWCGEHAVPESLCTRCNASLVAGFQATGDWCSSHGLPESQCLTCNPDLVITRPPKPTGP